MWNPSYVTFSPAGLSALKLVTHYPNLWTCWVELSKGAL